MRDLFKRVKILENNKESKEDSKNDSKPALEEIICTALMCTHARFECQCTCENHIAERLEEFEARPGNCICRQFHNPPIKPCGCVSEEELNSIKGYSISINQMWSLDNERQWKRMVPGMFSFYCVQGMDLFNLCRRGDQIIKTGEGKVEILADIPYERSPGTLWRESVDALYVILAFS